MKKLLIILIILFPSLLFSKDIEIKADNHQKIKHYNNIYYIPFKLIISKNKYIYGNPKGPGVGKATIINAKIENRILLTDIQIDKPEKYYPSGELKWIWRYINQTTFYIPIKLIYFNKSKILKLNIHIDALLCDDKSCLPVIINYIHTIKKSTLINLPVGQKEKPSNTLVLEKHTQEEIKTETEKTLPDFYPRLIKQNPVSNILLAIIFAFLAGLILNFMPCVLPVISLKLLNIVKIAAGNSKKIFLSGILFTCGMLLSFIILASLAVFANYNWGSLFQNTSFLIIMTLIIFIFALSLIGIFTMQIPFLSLKSASKNYKNLYIDSFIKGFFTTLLATPCSGPFLGTTLTWTLTQPVHIIYIIFIFIGLGMSLPYLLISIKPKLIRFIPKPGNWTIYFEKIMGFLLIGTVVYLLGILPQNYHIKIIWMLFVVSIGFWQYGILAAPTNKKSLRIFSVTFLIIFLFLGYYLIFINYSSQNKGISKEPFSFEKLIESKNQNKISIVEFTADWCPNCKIVESITINTKNFKNLIVENNISFFVADITNKGTEAEKFLKKLKGRSIPFLAVFGTDSDFYKPYCLYDIYTYDDIKDAVLLLKKESKKIKIDTFNF